jgi:hypothetical protein
MSILLRLQDILILTTQGTLGTSGVQRLPLPSAVGRSAVRSSMGGPSAAGPSAASHLTSGPSIAGPSTQSVDHSHPPDSGTDHDNTAQTTKHMKKVIDNLARESLKRALFNNSLMLSGEKLVSQLDDAITDALSQNKGMPYPFSESKTNIALDLAKKWTSKDGSTLKKNLRMAVLNIRNDIKRLARTIALSSWGLSPNFESQIEDIVAYRRDLVAALIQNYDHVHTQTAVSFFLPPILSSTKD